MTTDMDMEYLSLQSRYKVKENQNSWVNVIESEKFHLKTFKKAELKHISPTLLVFHVTQLKLCPNHRTKKDVVCQLE